METPLLRAENVRVDESGAPILDGASFRTRGQRVLVLGAPRVLFRAACGTVPLARGELRVAGLDASGAARAGAIAPVPIDGPLPLRWSVREYVEWSARLAGLADVVGRARAVLEPLALGPAADLRIQELAVPARRALAVAAGLVTGAPVLLVEDLLVGLGDDVALPLGAAFLRAAGDRAWVVFAARTHVLSPLAQAADEALVFEGSEVVAQGAPRELASRDQAFALRVTGDPRALVTALESSGAEAEVLAQHVVVRLAAGQTSCEIFARARDAGCVVVELRSLARSFS